MVSPRRLQRLSAEANGHIQYFPEKLCHLYRSERVGEDSSREDSVILT